jgi:hypothetical protein
MSQAGACWEGRASKRLMAMHAAFCTFSNGCDSSTVQSRRTIACRAVRGWERLAATTGAIATASECQSTSTGLTKSYAVQSGVNEVTGWCRVVHDNVSRLTQHWPVNMCLQQSHALICCFCPTGHLPYHCTQIHLPPSAGAVALLLLPLLMLLPLPPLSKSKILHSSCNQP